VILSRVSYSVSDPVPPTPWEDPGGFHQVKMGSPFYWPPRRTVPHAASWGRWLFFGFGPPPSGVPLLKPCYPGATTFFLPPWSPPPTVFQHLLPGIGCTPSSRELCWSFLWPGDYVLSASFCRVAHGSNPMLALKRSPPLFPSCCVSPYRPGPFLCPLSPG